MSLTIIITDAGRAAIVNAENTGTAPVTINEIGVSDSVIVPDAADIAMAGEIKRVDTISGEVVADDTIHVTLFDDTADVYTLRAFALYLDDGTLFGIYGQSDPILDKTAQSVAALSIDVKFADIDAETITFGDATFSNPPASTTNVGVVRLTTVAEAQVAASQVLALTPYAAKLAVLQWLLGLDGAGSGLDADLLDGQHGSWYADIPSRLGFTPLNAAAFTAAAIKTMLLTVDGAGSGIDADMLDGFQASSFVRVIASSNLQNGGYRIYSDGYRECWGQLTIPGNADNYSVNFPAACQFTLWSKTFIEGTGGSGNAQDNPASIRASNLTNFKVDMARDNSVICNWFAKGY